MKKYTSTIARLYESEAGFIKIESGETYLSKRGTKLRISNIFIDASSQIPDVYVEYSFETEDGQKGEEKNRFTVVVDMLRNS